MPNPGDVFESYIQFIFQALLDSQGKNISVSRGATVYDNFGNAYQIDVFYEFDVAGVHHRVAIECKDARKPVDRDDAIAFAGKIQDLPSTIGVFISKSGFRPAARKYLEDHGISHYSGDTLPRFGSVLAAVVSQIALPSESAIGQPFWTVMQLAAGQTTGVWCGVPEAELHYTGGQTGAKRRKRPQMVIPLFYSRPHAQLFHRLAFDSSPDVCVRGLEQPALRFLVLSANDGEFKLATFEPVTDDGSVKFACREWGAQDLAKEYCVEDLTGHFENSSTS
jgi:hypothetical protein